MSEHDSMTPKVTADLDLVLTDFLARYAQDVARGDGPASLAEYQARYPGFEGEVAAEYHALSGGEEGGDDVGSAFDTDCFNEAIGGATLLNVATGDRIGRYVVLRELGRGGQGVVFEALDEKLDRVVAVKMIVGLGLLAPETVARFEREGRLAARIEHPNVCTVYEVGLERDMPFIAMQRARGETLAARIRERRALSSDGGADPMAVDDVLRFVAGVARGVAAAHAEGIVHRDLKPGNIYVQSDGQPMILDFGLARDLDDDNPTITGPNRAGTPAYMAPEQYTKSSTELDERTDIYALGVILYEALTLSLPFDRDPLRVTAEIVSERPPNVVKARPGLPRGVRTVVDAALEPDARDRYSSMTAFADDLDRILDGRPPAVRPVSTLSRLWSSIRRRPVRAAVIAVAVLLAAVLGVVGYGMIQERSEQSKREERRAYHTDLEDAFRQSASGAVMPARKISARLDSSPIKGRLHRYLRCALDSGLDGVEALPVPAVSLIRRGSGVAAVLVDGRVLQLGKRHTLVEEVSLDGLTAESAASDGRALVLAAKVSDTTRRLVFRESVGGPRWQTDLRAAEVRGLEISRDGTVYVATRNEVYAWTPRAGGGCKRLPVTKGGWVYSITVSPDDRWLAVVGSADTSGTSTRLVIYRRTDLTEVSSRLASPARHMRFDPAGVRLVVASVNGQIASYGVGGAEGGFLGPKLKGVESLAFARDGHRILLGRDDGSITQLDRRLRPIDARGCGPKGAASALAYSERQRVVFGVGGNTVRAWDLDRFDNRARYRGVRAYGMAFLGEDHLVLMDGTAEMRHIDLTTARHSLERWTKPVSHVARNARGRYLWNTAITEGLQWTPADGGPTQTYSMPTGVVNALDAHAAVSVRRPSSPGDPCVLVVRQGVTTHEIPWPEGEARAPFAVDVCGEKEVVLARSPGRVWVAQFDQTRLRQLYRSTDSTITVKSAALSGDGQLVAIGLSDGAILVLATANGALVDDRTVEGVPTHLAFANGNDCLAVSVGEGLYLFRQDLPEAVRLSAPAPIRSLAFSLSGERLAVRHGGGVDVWSTNRSVRRLPAEAPVFHALGDVVAKATSPFTMIQALAKLPDTARERAVDVAAARFRRSWGWIGNPAPLAFAPPAFAEREWIWRRALAAITGRTPSDQFGCVLVRRGPVADAKTCLERVIRTIKAKGHRVEPRVEEFCMIADVLCGASIPAGAARLPEELAVIADDDGLDAYRAFTRATRTESPKAAAERLGRQHPRFKATLSKLWPLAYGQMRRVHAYALCVACDGSATTVELQRTAAFLRDSPKASHNVRTRVALALLDCRLGRFEAARRVGDRLRSNPKGELERGFGLAILALCDVSEGVDATASSADLASCPAIEHELLLQFLWHEILRRRTRS